jgi:hypothetical protein
LEVGKHIDTFPIFFWFYCLSGCPLWKQPWKHRVKFLIFHTMRRCL